MIRVPTDPLTHGVIDAGVPLGVFDLLPDVSPEEPTHRFRLLRGNDLVHLQVLAYRCEVVPGEPHPVLVPAAAGAWLEVRYPFQHLGERAFYAIEENKVPTPNPPEIEPVLEDRKATEPPQPPPLDVRAAFGSRLVYDLPDGEEIPYTTAGVLAALSRLELRVTALATPRPQVRRPPSFSEPIVVLGGGLVLARAAEGLHVRSATATWARDHTIGEPISGAIRAARDGITARRILATESALDFAGDATRAGAFADRLRLPVPRRRTGRKASRPSPSETAIEAPYRLIISPSELGAFAHSPDPVAAPADETRVELWHSRLGVRGPDATVDEAATTQRIVRAVWTRDLEYYDDPQDFEDAETSPFEPFRLSLDRRDRRILVRQTAETVITDPKPVDVDKLHLSALGAWLDLHSAWNREELEPYLVEGDPSILSWDHVAPMGRDQFVRVVYPGYLFPFGHQAALVKVTERKIRQQHEPQAYLYQRKFIIVGEPVRSFDQLDLPFREVRVRPLVTPDLEDPASSGTPHVIQNQDLFWPVVGGDKFRFTLDCRDHDGGNVRLHAPLLFVASHLGAEDEDGDETRSLIESTYLDDNVVDGDGQWTAFARSTIPGDTTVEVRTFSFAGTAEIPAKRRAEPRLETADVVIPAMRQLAPEASEVTVNYLQDYVDNGFAPDTEVFLELATGTAVSYATAGTGNAGGFIEPNLPITQLSRSLGAVGDLAGGSGSFDPLALLAGAVPRLFGMFDLVDVLKTLGLDELPRFITEAVDEVAGLLLDLQRLQATVTATIDRLQEDVDAATAPVKAQLDQARADLEGLRADLETQVNSIASAFQDVLAAGTRTAEDVQGEVQAALAQLLGIADDVRTAIDGVPLPPTVKAELQRLLDAVEPLLEAADLVDTIIAYLNAIDPEGLSVRARYVWQPKMQPWPASGSAVFIPKEDGFTLSLEARASGTGDAGVDVLADLRDFMLELLPGEPLMRMTFGRIAFRGGTGRKPEVDVVFKGIEYLGILGFIDTLRELIPFDGFADPPYLDVSAEGVTAGFDLGLPNVAVGVFSLENISLGADCRVPFLGDFVSVGFSFCSRERPFRMTVMAIGGGGFVAIRLSPQGLVALEMALEAGASLSLDFGVASGSVSVMVGLYMRLESDAGSLTGYFRIRGEVDVLGLISASITLELSLAYEFETGKMVGRASLVVEVEVLFFSASVTISVERRLAGSNGDPTFRQIMGVGDTGASEAWDDYCTAFAGV